MARKSDPRLTQILNDSLPDEEVLRSMIRNIRFTIEKAEQLLNTPVVDGATRQDDEKEILRNRDLLKKYEADLQTRLTVKSQPDALRQQQHNRIPKHR